MKSLATERFWNCYSSLPKEIQQRAQKAYRLFRDNSRHPSLRLKKVVADPPVYSARITQSYRALGVKEDNKMIWFWIGSHEDYEHLLKEL